jgi:hypothetical protein
LRELPGLKGVVPTPCGSISEGMIIFQPRLLKLQTSNLKLVMIFFCDHSGEKKSSRTLNERDENKFAVINLRAQISFTDEHIILRQQNYYREIFVRKIFKIYWRKKLIVNF